MNQEIFLGVSVGILLAAGFIALFLRFFYRKNTRVLTPLNVLLGGVLLAAVVLFWPAYFRKEQADWLRTLCLSVYSSFRLFAADGDYEIIAENIMTDTNVFYLVYTTLLMVLAPVLTFSVVLSFFRNASATLRLWCNFGSDLCVFSHLNEKSVALAKDLKKNRKLTVVFTDVEQNEDGSLSELQESAYSLNAIYFKKDILGIKWKFHSKKRSLWFFAIDENEEKNIRNSLRLMEEYGETPNSRLYLFSTGLEGEALLHNAGALTMKVRRINEVQSNIQRLLYEQGHRLFENALPGDDGMKQINAVVIGLGKHGSEMVKALAWYGQMDGYRIRIDAFDADPLAKDKFEAQCPELMDPKYNGVYVAGEAQYLLKVHSGLDVQTKSFVDELAKLPEITYVLVALGTDDANIRAALDLRMRFERLKCKPIIQAIVFNTEKKKTLSGLTNYRGQAYDVEFVCDLESACSEDVIINSDLEADALRRHLQWGQEQEFWNYEYNYRSSIALAIAANARIKCGIDVNDDAVIEPLEHRRWNAYMRSQGYVYSGNPDKSSRNDLGKMHHNLVDFETLPESDKRKDSAVGGA